jgi:hypothetical protein
MFISPETMVHRALYDTKKVPKEYRNLVTKILNDIEEIKSKSDLNTARYSVNFTSKNIERIAKTLDVDAAVITTITVHKDHYAGDITAFNGYILMTLDKLNIFNQWEILEVKYLPIDESRRSFRFPDDFYE